MKLVTEKLIMQTVRPENADANMCFAVWHERGLAGFIKSEMMDEASTPGSIHPTTSKRVVWIEWENGTESSKYHSLKALKNGLSSEIKIYEI